MGLAVVHGIVTRYKGYINLDSQIGKGTRFEIYLPQFESEKDDNKNPEDQLIFGSERILFIDDEEVQTDLGKQLLEKLGYRVDTQTNSRIALDTFKEDPERYDLIITDMTMPNMSGDQLSREILSIRPDMPIILSTGYNEQMSEEKAKEIGIKGYVHKPVVLKEMSKIIRQVLQEN